MSDQVKKTAGKRRWLRRLLWSAALIFGALQVHSYYYLRFMVMYPFSATYEPSIPADPVASKRVDVLNGLITPMFQSIDVARMHWTSLSQSPPQIAGLTLLEDRGLEKKIMGFSGQTITNSYSIFQKYNKNQTFRGAGGGAVPSIFDGIYVIFEDRVCHTTGEYVYPCIAIYYKYNHEYIYYIIKSNHIAKFDSYRM